MQSGLETWPSPGTPITYHMRFKMEKHLNEEAGGGERREKRQGRLPKCSVCVVAKVLFLHSSIKINKASAE